MHHNCPHLTERTHSPFPAQDSPFHAQYELLDADRLGAGAFAICMPCRCRRTGQLLCVKVMRRPPTAAAAAAIDTEVQMLRRCQGHPAVVRLVDALHDATYTYIVTERLCGGQLEQRASDGGLDAAAIEAIVCQLLAGIAHMHRCGVAHRDLKPANVVFATAAGHQLRIVDFGFARPIADAAGMRGAEYTMDYAAPERLSAKAGRHVTQACDLWSLGAIMYRLLCGRRPFGDGATAAVRRNVQRGRFDRVWRGWRDLEPRMRHVIAGLLNVKLEPRESAVLALRNMWEIAAEEAEAEGAEAVAARPQPVANDDADGFAGFADFVMKDVPLKAIVARMDRDERLASGAAGARRLASADRVPPVASKRARTK